MKKQLLLIVLMFVGFMPSVSAQKGPHNFSPQKFREDMENFIILHTGMTALDAKNFFPLYHELHDKQRKINKEIMRLKRLKNATNLTDRDYKAYVERIMDLKVEFAEVERDYYKKMCKVVSPRKVHAVLLAEDKFHRRMLQNLHGKKQFVKTFPAHF